MVNSFHKQVSLPPPNQVSHILFPEAITFTYAKIAYVYKKGGVGVGERVCFKVQFQKAITFFPKILIEWQNK